MKQVRTIDELPALLRFNDGALVAERGQWPRRRQELREAILTHQYGHLPPAPGKVGAELLHAYGALGALEAPAAHYRLVMEPGGLSFNVHLLTPPGKGPFPTIVDGDGCWDYLTEEIRRTVVERGFALAFFNRTEVAADAGTETRTSGLYKYAPEGDYGAVAAWAWGYHRVVDLLLGVETVDPARLIAAGHSRGGKAALLAGATDERFALTAPNDSGCFGAGCTRFPDVLEERRDEAGKPLPYWSCQGERLEDMLRGFPYWCCRRLREYGGRVADLPCDQHFLKALVAPRGLLTTEARGDIWASPRGTRLTHEAAREVYRFMGVPERIGIWYREGGHAHGLADWEAMLDFADWQFTGQQAARDFDMKPE